MFSEIIPDDDNPNLKRVAIWKRNTSNKETDVTKTVSVQNEKKEPPVHNQIRWSEIKTRL